MNQLVKQIVGEDDVANRDPDVPIVQLVVTPRPADVRQWQATVGGYLGTALRHGVDEPAVVDPAASHEILEAAMLVRRTQPAGTQLETIALADRTVFTVGIGVALAGFDRSRIRMTLVITHHEVHPLVMVV